MIQNGKEELIMEAVDTVEAEDGNLRMVNIFGDQKVLHARIRSLALVNHRIIIEENRS
ncbi:MAG: CooT family nickel-binding protein [Pseudomonadota bacterium]